MSATLKPVGEQVIVITGASSGIGLATAQAAAERGARVVLAARSKDALDQVVSQINTSGGLAIAVACDVADREQVEQVARTAAEQFGRIDTWVNNAGVSIYGRLEQVAEADSRRLFDTNFWGVCNGSLAALPYLKRSKGALINVGSEVSEAAVPLLGMYTATKHAVKGFTDSLRIEVEEVADEPVSITLIQPTAVDTPFPQHARNYMAFEPKLPQQGIDPSKVAEAILHAAEHPTRDKKVGGGAVMNVAMSRFAPHVADKMSAKAAGKLQYDEPPRNPQGALFEPSATTGVVGQTHGTGGVEVK